MSSRSLSLLAGGSAALGGALRVFAAFVPWRPDSAGLEIFYLAIDLLLLFGLIGIYLDGAARLGVTGLIGFVLALGGLASIVGPDPVAFGIDGYAVGSSVLALGLALMAVPMLRNRVSPLWVPWLWIATPASALLADVLAWGEAGRVVAGVCFGAAFVGAGLARVGWPGGAGSRAVALVVAVAGTLSLLAGAPAARAADVRGGGRAMQEIAMELNQVTLPALDLAKSVDYYRRFGLKLIVHSPENQYARFEIPGGEGTLSLHVEPARVREPSAHVYFETATPEALVERLRAQSIEPVEPLEDKPWLWREAWYVDPAGNRLCVYRAGANRKNPPWRLAD